MKTAILTFFAAICFSASGNAQEWKWRPLPEGPIPNVPLFKTPNNGNNFYFKKPGDSLTSFHQAIPPGVYYLPQDGMPCIVPDLTGLNPIPNVSPIRQLPLRTNIPNAAPFRSHPPFPVPRTK